MSKVLIIDDDKMMCKALSMLLKKEGIDATCEYTSKKGLQRALMEAFDIVLIDVMLPDGNGINIVQKIMNTFSKPEAIIITADGDPDGAELAIRSGAWDYIEKGSSLKEIILPISRALQYHKEKLSTNSQILSEFEGIIGNSPELKACFDLLIQAARSEANVLLYGDTGTGKELFARAIHYFSSRNKGYSVEEINSINKARADNNFVVVDCTALPETLVESVLFGHEKGAFTGADRVQEGLIKQADGGTLFLDEIGEMPFKTQKKFLRVLQDHHFRPLGSKKELQSKFRLIAATNRNLAKMSEDGQFRVDLLYRLQSLTIELPPLRQRSGDIRDLAEFYIAKICDRYSIESKNYSPDFLKALETYNWPGNVRELVNALEAAVAASGKEQTLFSHHLPISIRIYLARKSVRAKKQKTSNSNFNFCFNGSFPLLKDFRNGLEKQYLQELIFYSGKDIKKACKIAGLSRSRIYELFSKHNISISQDMNCSSQN